MKIVILDRQSIGYDTPIESLKEIGELVIYDNTTEHELPERIKDAEILLLNKIKITEKIINSAKLLKLICVFATGYDNIDITAARRRGIAVCNVPAYSTESVTLFTLATALSLITHLNQFNAYVRCGKYSDSGLPNLITPVFHELKGKTWGIVGGGNIGLSVAKVAEAFGARVIINKRNKISSYPCVDLNQLCRESDIISIHCPLTPQTHNLINSEKISIMKDSVIIINEARGAVVCEADIAEAILNKRIAGFGCDVYSVEPFPKNHPYNTIKDFENVILTPHAAWASYEARCRCIEIVAENIKSFLNGEMKNRVEIDNGI